MRSPKNISAAYLKFIQKEDWYGKALQKLPQFKKHTQLPSNMQEEVLCDSIAMLCSNLLNELRLIHPQTSLNGTRNLWIVKPGGLSRGRNIRLFRDYNQILEYA